MMKDNLSENMKILIISHMFPSKEMPYYGTFVFQQAQALQSLNNDVVVLCPVPWTPKWLPVKAKHWKAYQNIPLCDNLAGIKVYYPRVPGIRSFRWRGILYFYKLFFFLKTIFKKYNFDIIHTHTVLPDSDFALLVKKKFNIPLVVTVHGADLQILIFRKKAYKKRIYQILNQSDSVILVSKKLLRLLKAHAPQYFKLSHCQVVYNGIKIYKKYPTIDWGKNAKSIKLLTIASLRLGKGFELVFTAIQKLKDEYADFMYFIIGEGWDKEVIEKLIHKYGIADRVCLLGGMTHEKAMAYLKEADIFVMPSKIESFGIVYIEAMFMKKITFGSRGQGIGEIIKDGQNGFLIDPDDAEELTNKLRKILSNLDHYENVRENAYQSVYPEFTWEENAKKICTIYEKLPATL